MFGRKLRKSLIDANMAASLLYMLELAQNMKESEVAAMICEQDESISDDVIMKQTAVDNAKAHVKQLELELDYAKTKLARKRKMRENFATRGRK